MNDESTNASITTIKEAYKLVKPYINKTPVLTSKTINEIASKNCGKNRQIYFKCENFQKVGAFKARGAINAVFRLSDSDAKKGVVTHSSGNHAQAIAYAAKLRKIPAHIVMPSNSPMVKKNAVEGYGAKIYLCEPTLDARESTTKRIMAETDSSFIHPYNNDNVISGQGTVFLEFVEQLREKGVDIDTIISPVGGGGLMSGVSISAKSYNKYINVIGAEPSGANDAFRSLECGKLLAHSQGQPNTICDGLLTTLGSKTFQIIQKNVTKIITIEDSYILKAMKLVWERMKIIIEPSSAVPVAIALFSEEFKKLNAESIGIIISGGNVEIDTFPWSKSKF